MLRKEIAIRDYGCGCLREEILDGLLWNEVYFWLELE